MNTSGENEMRKSTQRAVNPTRQTFYVTLRVTTEPLPKQMTEAAVKKYLKEILSGPHPGYWLEGIEITEVIDTTKYFAHNPFEE